MILVNNIASIFVGRVRHFAAIVLGAMMMVSCADAVSDYDSTESPREGYLTLELSGTSMRSRAEEPGEDSRHENLIDHALICLMPDGYTDANVPILMKTFNFPEKPNTTAVVQMKLTRDLVDNLFPKDDATGKNVTTAKVYVIANLPTIYTDSNLAGKTISELKGLTIESDFASSADQPYFVMDNNATINLNVSTNDIAKSTVTGEVLLTRATSKISLSVNIASDKVTDDSGRQWEALKSTMSVLITNGVKKSTVVPAAGAVPADNYYYTSVNAVNTNERGRDFEEIADAEYPLSLKSPFYTYPNNWAADDGNMTYMTLSMMWHSENAYRTCYYMVPVVASGKSIVRNVSYHVNIKINILGSTDPDNPFEVTDVSYRAIDWGKEEVKVNIDDFRYLILDQMEYTLNNEGMISIPFYSSHETVIKYSADELNYYLFNVTAQGIEREMTITDAQRNRSTTTLLPDSLGKEVKIYSDWIDNKADATTGTRTLYFHHELYQWSAQNGNGPVSFGPYEDENAANSTSDGLNSITRYVLNSPLTAAYSRYRMKITIVHKDKLEKEDEADFSQTVYITQYPGMYITVDPNPAVQNEGNVYVNGRFGVDAGLGQIGMSTAGQNSNINMYIINVSQLSTNSGYYIGDPRSKYINNDLSGVSDLIPTDDDAVAGEWNAIGPSLYHESSNPERRLSYYYPTNESQDTYSANMIAPKLRIASSWGGTSLGTKENFSGTREKARRRVATYQEQYCPAGRWRLPTLGEFKYITQLSAAGKIPTLFTISPSIFEYTDENNMVQSLVYYYVYWTAQGPYMIGKDGTVTKFDENDSSIQNCIFTVRAVYDEWYWEQYENYRLEPSQGNTYFNYTYGDMPVSVTP